MVKNSSFYSLKEKKKKVRFSFPYSALVQPQQQVYISPHILSREKPNHNSYTKKKKKSQMCREQLIMSDLHIHLITCWSK